MIIHHTEITTTSSAIVVGNINSHNIVYSTSFVLVDRLNDVNNNGVFVKGKIRSLENEKNNYSEAGY